MSQVLKALTAVSKPVLMHLPPELSHDLAITSLKWMPLPEPGLDDPRLETWALRNWFTNPIGLAAGFDKGAEIIPAIRKLGFGFTEIGSVTPLPQKGNSKPRLWRNKDTGEIVNRMGMNSEGFEVVHSRIKRQGHDFRIGVSLGVNESTKPRDLVQDYIEGINKFWHVADYLVINISCPNSATVRSAEFLSNFGELVSRLMEHVCKDYFVGAPPILVKISPDMTLHELDQIVKISLGVGMDGLIVSNTHKMSNAPSGGHSGRPLFSLSTQMLAETYIRVGKKIPLIGVGGVDSAETAWSKIEAGATLVQVLSGFVFEGLNLVNEIKSGLVDRIKASGKPLSENVGSRAGDWIWP